MIGAVWVDEEGLAISKGGGEVTEGSSLLDRERSLRSVVIDSGC